MVSTDALPMNSLLIGAFTAVLLALLLLLSRKKKSPKLNLPPSPSRLPIIGNLHQIGSAAPHKSLQSLSRKHGDLMLLHFGCDPTLIVSSADSAREIFKTHIGAHFNNRPASITAKRLLYDGKDIGFAPYGEYWRNTRRICADQILSTKRVQFYHPVRREELSLLAERIRASCSDGSAINMGHMLMNLTMSSSSRMALGRKYEEEGNRLEDMLAELMALFMTFPCRDFIPWLGWIDSLVGLDARAKRNAAQIDRFLETALDEHIRAKRHVSADGKECMDFVDVLLSLKDESLERIHIKALILDMLFAGTDTIYSTMESMMGELVNNPRVMKILQEEIRRLAGSKEMVTDEDCNKMDYLDAVMKETLRMHPSVPLMIHRQTARDVEVGGYDVPEKTRVIVNIYAIGRDPRTWGERADGFWPERFRCSDVDFLGQHCRFIPFGVGRRICPGSGLAITTAKFTIANLLLHFDWQTPDGAKAKIREPFGGLKDSGLILVAKPRSP